MSADSEVRHDSVFRQGWIILLIGSCLVIIAIFLAVILNVRPVDIFDETSRESAGKLVSISAVPTSWNEGTKSIVTTDRGYFIVRGYISAYTGDPVEIVEYSNGSKRLCVRKDNCKKLVGM